MGAWSSDSKTHVATMSQGDFRNNEKSLTLSEAQDVRIELVDEKGDIKVLKEKVALQKDEIIDATVMSKKALVAFLKNEVEDAKYRPK